ncbi:RNA-binding ATPase activator esf2 [Yamadazyma tenuis]|uniref:Pre-rRNA-processing protein ESF2 n=1 Tax=Candida tenuis (strain ATCC 10573 / BCRC 21748 / CBS 615 / JCM 9827 / NBRC 10315 / NRRL Y-1498 / VKM Y-70) TaxID=590646 RepID=G3B9L5_CANTC|nr:uncharacterized protein CANTEDRAFT_94796 [Yamadazyma tenuis ATCC 10573]EGV61922.1 hypothetical protein CANTEDRAFT_94796 [Yamadazyma tenuis ATCC 10573]WEJ93154.1 RNA-binding ATPase activator esf2 [Yamadazyma tenuis]
MLDSEYESTAKKLSSKVHSDSEDDFNYSEDEYPIVKVQKKSYVNEQEQNEEEEPDDEENETGEGAQLTDDEVDEITQVKSKTRRKLKGLTPEQLEKEQKRIKKTGVCYLSSIPPYMKPSKLRSILSRFGKIDRLFLKPEDQKSYKRRVKYGGNKKRNYTEGWVEFLSKKDAKLCVDTMNGNIIGGKKTSYYYDDILNIKYLKNFKWMDLTQQISRENEIKQSKLALELSQQQKLNKTFVNNLDQSKMIKNIKRKKGTDQDDDVEIRRNFKQRNVTSTRADAKDDLKKNKPNEQLNDFLSKVF